MFLDRNGYLEKDVSSRSLQSDPRETGGIGGLFHPVTETTAKNARRAAHAGVARPAAQAGKARASEDALTLAAQTLSEFEFDVPFALFYLLGSKG